MLKHRLANLATHLNIGFRIAHRARLSHFLGVALLVLVASCFLAAQFSGRQPATVALDVGISVIRLLMPVLTTLLLLELLYKEFERKYYFLSLTYPSSRYAFLLSRSLFVLVYSLAALAILVAVLWVTVFWIGKDYAQSRPPNLGLPLLVTMLFFLLDLIVTIAVGLLAAIAASSASFVLVGTLGFVLCARSFSPIIDLLTRDNTLVSHTETYHSSLSALGYFFPDLARLDVRMISLYNTMFFLPDDWPRLVLTTLSYALALYCLSVWLISRRRFS